MSRAKELAVVWPRALSRKLSGRAAETKGRVDPHAGRAEVNQGRQAGNGIRRRIGLLAMVAMLLFCLRAVGLAQTAHSVGEVTTFGTGFSNPHAIVLDPAGNLYVANYTDGIIYKEALDSSTGAYAQSVLFSGFDLATGLARDSAGNFYIASKGLIYKEALQANGSYAQSVLGSFDHAVGVAVDPAGNLFVVDDARSSLYELAAGTYTQTTLDYDTLATPYSVSIDAAGNLYVGTVRGEYIHKYTLVSGSYVASTPLDAPGTYGVIADSVGDLFYASPSQFLKATPNGNGGYTVQVFYDYRAQTLTEDASNVLYAVSFFESNGIRIDPAPSFGVVPVGTTAPRQISLSFTLDTAGTLGKPQVLTQGSGGLDFSLVATTCSGTLDAGTSCTVTVNFTPTVPGLRSGAVDLTDASGNVLAAAVVRGVGTAPQGVIYNGTTSVARGVVSGPVAVDGAGNVFAATASGSLAKETVSGPGFTQSALGTGIGSVSGLAVDGAGDVFVADSTQQQVVEEHFNPVTNTYTQTVPFTAAVNQLTQAGAVAVDGGGTVYLGNGNQILREVPNGSGYIQSVAAGGFTKVAALALDSAGSLFVGDAGTSTLYKETPQSGTGSYGSLGFTQNVVAGGLGRINGIALDAAGTVYVTAPGTSDAVLRFLPNGAGSYTADASFGDYSSPGGVAMDGQGNLVVSSLVNGNGALTRVDVGDPETLTFAARAVGTTSSAQTVTLRNIGNAALGMKGLGTSSANFALDGTTTTCAAATTLAPSQDCMVGTAFTPQLAGPLQGTANITDNHLSKAGAIQTVLLAASGNSGPVAVGVSNTSVVYGAASAMLTATVTYAGTVPPSGAFAFAVDGGSKVSAVCGGAATPLTCTATYPTGALSVGTHTILATIAADQYYNAGSGTGTLTLTPPVVAGFNLTNRGATSATVTAGSSTTFSFLLAPTGSGFPGEVSLSVSGLPAKATYTLTPSSVGANGTQQVIQLAIQTVAATAANTQERAPWSRDSGVALALLALPLCLVRRGRHRLGRVLTVALVTLGSLAAVTGLTGCGLIREGYEAPAAYTVTLTAVSGTVTHTAAVQLTVQ